MIEATANGSTGDQAAFAMAAKPRVSASSFKDLTARLRKAEIPVLTPVVPPPPVVPTIVAIQAPLSPYVAPTQFVPPPMLSSPPVVLETHRLPEQEPVWTPAVPPPVVLAPLPEPEPELAVEPPVIEIDAAELVAKDDAANEALKELAKSRQHQLELESIWRMLLATPSGEERVVYLREAGEIMGIEVAELPPSLPEFDLSVIAPAEEMESPSQPETLELDAAPEPQVVLLQDDDPASIDNADLARSLLDMMASGASSGLPQERALAADTLLRLIPRLDLKSLVMLSQRVARMDDPPSLLVGKLLRDARVEVSGPLLADCQQITDRDLENVIAENDMARMRMIARRRRLTHSITDALVNCGDPSVQLTLVRNAEAEISQEGFLQLIAAAGSNIDLLAPLCTRADMSAPMAFELFWYAPAQLRRFILSRFLTDSETLTKILRITMSTNELDQLNEQEGSMQHTVVEALERAARGKIDIAADELAGVLKVDSKTVRRILKDDQGEPLVVMLKVAGYPRQALSGLLNRFRDVDIGLVNAAREAEELVSIFETLSFNKARILLTYWDWSQRKTGPYAPLH